MKKLLTLLSAFIAISAVYAAAPADDLRRGYDNSFIFQEGAIEFAVFPDGQFDFNYIDEVSQVNFQVNTPNVNFSFNTGYNYDPFVQYDTYGAVIQIENTPIYYDGYGRIIQAGNVFINYRNGYVNRVGNLNVFYSRPGIVFRTSGFINPFNRFYVYQPWHGYYGVPLVNRCIVWNTPYRLYYNPIRYDWSYHRVNWNRPYYYNGYYSDFGNRRNFYRPNDRVVYQSFEQGRRDTRGRLVNDRNINAQRAEIATGRRDVSRDRSSYTVASRSTSDRSTTGRSTETVTSRNDDSRRASTANREVNTSRTASVIADRNSTSRRSSVNNNAIESRSSRGTAAPARSNASSRTVESSRNVPTAVNTSSRASRASVSTVPQRTERGVQATAPQRTERRSATVAPQRTERAVPQAAPQRSSRTNTATPARSSSSKSEAPTRTNGRSSSSRSGRG